MKDYKNGKIYVIRNHVNDLIYVGSTIQGLAERMGGHRATLKQNKILSTKIYKAFYEIGIEHFYIELIEDCPCETREQLLRREGYYIREYDSFKNGYNGLIAGQTVKEYREANKKIIAEKFKIYHANNKEKIVGKQKIYYDNNKERIYKHIKEWYEVNKHVILEKGKVKYTCNICNCEFRIDGKSEHERSKKHIDNIKKLKRVNKKIE
jgi:hypothetical protein